MADSSRKQSSEASQQRQRPDNERQSRSLAAGIRRSNEADEISRRRERAQLMRLKNRSRRVR